MIQPISSGMVAHSAVNPTDEIPVGPQVYPYGTPKLAESTVNPYLSTNYPQAIQTAQVATTQYQTTAIPTATSVELVQPVSAVQEVYQTAAVETPAAAVATQVVETPVAAVQEVYQTPPVVSQIGYQKVIRYRPVTKTTLVPRVTTSYATVPANTVVNPVVPAVAAPVVPAPVVPAPVVPAPAVAAPVVTNPVLAGSVVANPVVSSPVVTNSLLAGPVVPTVLPQAGVALPASSGHYVSGYLGR